ncbi:MAG TPA: YkgJ family cysteine cluster protein [Sediminispirochaeta sp.]|nr:YkgJ family cysteine cluster protein [Sediminispirochaeta sp.]
MGGEFYNEGLRFECTRCSRCCRHEPGYVFLSYNDLPRLLDKFEMSRENFIQKYCRAVLINGVYRLSLKEKENYDCLFWEDGGCRIYEARPLQCRSFPFWASYLSESRQWQALGDSCPGVNRGPVHSREEIEQWLALREREPLMVLGEQDLKILEKEPV